MMLSDGERNSRSTDRAAGTGEDSFGGFASCTMLEAGGTPIEELALLALREGQSTSPLHRVHRWFARRLSSQFRGMLTALSLPEGTEEKAFWGRYFGRVPLDGAVALDPFAGGGTAVVEASRCGAKVVGLDVDPVAASIARFELAAAGRAPLSRAAARPCENVSARTLPWHRTLVDGEERRVLHHFWVELRACASCREEFEVHPHYRLAYDKDKGLQWAFCRGCHGVQELPLGRKELRCRVGCSARTRVEEGALRGRRVRCPYCGSRTELSDRAPEAHSPPRYRLFAQEYLVEEGKRVRRLFKAATEEDRRLYEGAAAELRVLEDRLGPFAPGREIPARHRSDGRPILHGFSRYRDLFNDRQLLHLSLLGRAISQIGDEGDKEWLGLAFSEHLTTNCLYTGYAFGYRRLSPLFSMHAYRHIVRPVEVNPWLAGIGRGTFPNVLAKVGKGVAFAKAPTDLHTGGGRVSGEGPVGPPDGRVGRSPADVVNGDLGAAVAVQDSTDLSDFPDASVDLVLTDPPYLDNVSYSELSDFYLVWRQALGIAEAPYDDPDRQAPMDLSLAATDRGEEAVRAYAAGLRGIFAECRRVLRPGGLFLFTYHHASPLAWSSIGEAIATTDLTCTSVVPMRGEGQGGLHTHEGTIKWDAVLVLRWRPTTASSDGERDGAGREPGVGDGDDSLDAVIVPEDAPRRASATARAYADRLMSGGPSGEDLGFGRPDTMNLYRALVASESRVGRSAAGFVALRNALGRDLWQEDKSRERSGARAREPEEVVGG